MMALQANALLTVDDVFGYLRQTTPAPSDPNYTLIESLINRASDWVETYIGNPVINRQFTEYLDGANSCELTLSCFPVVSIQQVLNDGANITTDIDFEPWGLIWTKSGSAFACGRKKVQVTYTAGRGPDRNTIPQDIKQAALLVVHFWYKRDSLDYSQTFGESEIIVGQWRFPQTALEMLKPYRRKRVGVI